METKKEQGPVFPAGFEHVEERLNETTHRLEQLDNQINNRPKDKGPTIEYTPVGVFHRIIPGQQDRERIALQKEQHELKMETLSRTEADTRNADGNAGRLVRDAVREKLFPNPYRTLEPEDQFNDRHVLKEIEQSQDYMDAMLQPKPNVVKEKEVTNKTEATDKNNLSMSARFSLSLSYTKVTQREIGRNRDKEPDKDRD